MADRLHRRREHRCARSGRGRRRRRRRVRRHRLHPGSRDGQPSPVGSDGDRVRDDGPAAARRGEGPRGRHDLVRFDRTRARCWRGERSATSSTTCARPAGWQSPSSGTPTSEVLRTTSCWPASGFTTSARPVRFHPSLAEIGGALHVEVSKEDDEDVVSEFRAVDSSSGHLGPPLPPRLPNVLSGGFTWELETTEREDGTAAVRRNDLAAGPGLLVLDWRTGASARRTACERCGRSSRTATSWWPSARTASPPSPPTRSARPRRRPATCARRCRRSWPMQRGATRSR